MVVRSTGEKSFYFCCTSFILDQESENLKVPLFGFGTKFLEVVLTQLEYVDEKK